MCFDQSVRKATLICLSRFHKKTPNGSFWESGAIRDTRLRESTGKDKKKTLWQLWSNEKRKTQLPQRDCATRYVSKFVLCFTSYGRYKGFKQQKWPSRLFKGIGNGAVRYAIYDFLLVFYCNYVSILSIFEISLISQNLKRSRDSEHIPFGSNISRMYLYSTVSISIRNLYTVWLKQNNKRVTWFWPRPF